MTNAWLLYNPKAGRFDPETMARQAADHLRAHNWQVETIPTKSGAHLAELAAEAAGLGLDAILVAGGDGSIRDAVTGLVGRGPTALGVIPTGTANVFARELGLPNKVIPQDPRSLRQALSLLLEAQPRPVDIGFCNGEPFLLWAGIGLDALIVHRTEAGRSHLKKHFVLLDYFITTLRAAAGWKELDIELSTGTDPGSLFRGKCAAAVVTNIQRYAGGHIQLSPDADLGDGEMDLWLLPGRNLPQVLHSLWLAFRQRHLDHPGIPRFPFQSLDIRLQAPSYLQLDGDPRPLGQDFTIEVRKHAIQVLTPR